MKPVSKDLEEKLIRAGFPGTPPFSLDEVVEELSYSDLDNYWIKHRYKMENRYMEYEEFWLYTTMRSADAAAEVWLKMKRKEE